MKNKNSLIQIISLLLFLTAGGAFAEIKLADDDIVLIPHAYGHFQIGQVEHATGIEAHEGSYTIENLWTENAYSAFSFEAWRKEEFRMTFGIEVKMYFSWPQLKDRFETKYAKPDVVMGPTFASYFMKTDVAGNFEFDMGYFDYKYNPDVKNLGEYMFRSATYPAYIVAGFDSPQARLLGFRMNHQFLDSSLKNDILFTSETNFYPAMDWSLSWIGSYDVAGKGFLEIGAGFSMSHLISVYGDDYNTDLGGLTDPVNDNVSGNRYIVRAEDSIASGDSMIFIPGDTAYYTFRGDKLMGRISLDPKYFFPGSEKIFGKEDLKIYAEGLLIGTKSYPDKTAFGADQKSYKRWQEKTPVTFGVNLPAFGLLDVLNLEFERFGSKYINTYYEVYLTQSLPNAPGDVDGIEESFWKWSLYAKKSFLNGHFAVSGQVARDHMRLASADYTRANHREMLVEAGDWWWTIKSSYSF